MAAFTQILETQQDGVLTLTLNRPERLNAWTPVIQAELETAIRAASDNPDVRCIIITGAGRGFCAEADMKAGSAISMPAPSPSSRPSMARAPGLASCSRFSPTCASPLMTQSSPPPLPNGA